MTLAIASRQKYSINKMNNTDIEAKRRRIEGIVKVGGLCAAAFFVAPFVFIVIKGLLGMIAAAAIGWGVIFFTPVVARMAANLRLKAIKAEAARNPIETLQNDYGRRQQQLRDFAERIKDFGAAVESFKDKLGGFIKAHPEDAPKFQGQLQKMQMLLSNRNVKFKQAQAELEAYEGEIQRANDIWEMGQAASAMSSAAGMTQDDFLQKISTETALDAVQQSMNRAFADVEVSLLEETKAPVQLASVNVTGEPLEAEVVPVHAKRKVA